MEKICRRCGVKKGLDCFYAHSQMTDGHLNICKDCKKKDSSIYLKTDAGKMVDKKRNEKPERKEWLAKKQIENRKKHRKQYLCRSKFWAEFKKGKIQKIPCDICGTLEKIEAHHPDYNKPLEVIWLCCLHHKEWHRNNSVIL